MPSHPNSCWWNPPNNPRHRGAGPRRGFREELSLSEPFFMRAVFDTPVKFECFMICGRWWLLLFLLLLLLLLLSMLLCYYYYITVIAVESLIHAYRDDFLTMIILKTTRPRGPNCWRLGHPDTLVTARGMETRDLERGFRKKNMGYPKQGYQKIIDGLWFPFFLWLWC